MSKESELILGQFSPKKVFVGELAAGERVGQALALSGWVKAIRVHKDVAFVILTDSTGDMQVTLTSESEDGKKLMEIAKGVTLGSVVTATGVLQNRPPEAVNPKMATGNFELKASDLSVLAKADPLPFDLRKPVAEAMGAQYRYLELRGKRLAENIKARAKFVLGARNWLSEAGFTEIETPILTKSTPEGARDFLVPSRLHHGEFYALPQSPQQYKQLLMIAGVERYFQIARCFRDEDLRGDRQLEFTQIDLEKSFTSFEEIFGLVETMLEGLVPVISLDKKIAQFPFPRITHQEAMARYGSDKPDLRTDKGDKSLLHFGWITDFPMYERDEVGGRWRAAHHPFTMPNVSDLGLLREGNLAPIRAQSYDLVCNGYEIASGSMRVTDPEIQKLIFTAMGLSEQEVLAQFSHLLEAFRYGVPPHGGIALSVDRLVMLFRGEANIRDVIAFPASSSGRTAVMDAPSPIDDSTLGELGIKLI